MVSLFIIAACPQSNALGLWFPSSSPHLLLPSSSFHLVQNPQSASLSQTLGAQTLSSPRRLAANPAPSQYILRPVSLFLSWRKIKMPVQTNVPTLVQKMQNRKCFAFEAHQTGEREWLVARTHRPKPFSLSFALSPAPPFPTISQSLVSSLSLSLSFSLNQRV